MQGIVVGVVLLPLLFLLPCLYVRLRWYWTLYARNSPQTPCTRWYCWLPLVGDGLAFVLDPQKFWDLQRTRYGRTFLTNLFGTPTIMTSDPETLRFVLQTHPHLFSPSYPKSMDTILNGTSPWEGEFHVQMRNVLVPPLLPQSLKAKVEGSFDYLARWTINAWTDSVGPVILHQETSKYSLHVALSATCSVQPSKMTVRLKELYSVLAQGLTSMPINLPGFSFHKALKAKVEIVKEMQKIIDKRRTMRGQCDAGVQENDVLESFLAQNRRENEQHFSDQEIRISMFIMLLAGHESTSSFIAWAVKFLTENPDILHQVKDEQDGVRASKGSPQEPLTWEDTKRMPITYRVLQETLRLGNPVPLSPRVALHDIEYKGQVFPKDWQIFCTYRNVHMDPELYPNPTKFDPDRFLHNTKQYTFIPFGGGSRYCLGNKLAMLEALIFIHYMVTTFRWERIGSVRGVQNWPAPRPKAGFPILVHRLVGRSCEPPTHIAAG